MNILDSGTAQSDLIKDSSEATFIADVVEASQQVPIIVDFWAPWCGPCKTLGPVLEAAVKAAKGAVKMVKINIDEARTLAGRMHIQSVPTVYAFFNGRPVDVFQGALPPSEIKAFINRILAASGGTPPSASLDELAADAEQLLGDGAAVEAAQGFSAVLAKDSAHAVAYSGLARAHIALGNLDQAGAILDGAPAGIADAPELATARAQLALARQANDAGSVTELLAAVNADPDDHQSRFNLSLALHGKGNVEEAMDHLLELFRRDREWNDSAARSQLLTIFDSLPAKDPAALKGRRRLSSMIFA